MTHIECPVCEGYGSVVWENGLPRAPKADEAPTDECPACGGCGTEPTGDETTVTN